MAAKKISISEFVEISTKYPVVDVRSPGEYGHAHIPGARSLPLFTDEERKVVGTAYKQESREKAIKIGLEYFGKKMVNMVEQAEQLGSKTIIVHCWRGGMRSAGVAWLLDLYGFAVYTIAGGYKAYRNWVLQQFEKEYDLRIIGGYTGSAKTYVLKELQKTGEQIVDIEALANHKGSAFGNIGLPKQPSQEMFENLLATQLSVSNSSSSSVLWIEDESQRIGDVNIPHNFFRYMRGQPIFFLDVSFEQRLDHIVAEYGNLDKERLVNAVMRIQKRLGGLETKNAINHLVEGNIKESFGILLKYYDKWYEKSLQTRENWQQLVTKVATDNFDVASNALLLKKTLASQKENING